MRTKKRLSIDSGDDAARGFVRERPRSGVAIPCVSTAGSTRHSTQRALGFAGIMLLASALVLLSGCGPADRAAPDSTQAVISLPEIPPTHGSDYVRPLCRVPTTELIRRYQPIGDRDHDHSPVRLELTHRAMRGLLTLEHNDLLLRTAFESLAEHDAIIAIRPEWPDDREPWVQMAPTDPDRHPNWSPLLCTFPSLLRIRSVDGTVLAERVVKPGFIIESGGIAAFPPEPDWSDNTLAIPWTEVDGGELTLAVELLPSALTTEHLDRGAEPIASTVVRLPLRSTENRDDVVGPLSSGAVVRAIEGGGAPLLRWYVMSDEPRLFVQVSDIGLEESLAVGLRLTIQHRGETVAGASMWHDEQTQLSRLASGGGVWRYGLRLRGDLSRLRDLCERRVPLQLEIKGDFDMALHDVSARYWWNGSVLVPLLSHVP